jgi:uncharacterized delta-60 repeat protein
MILSGMGLAFSLSAQVAGNMDQSFNPTDTGFGNGQGFNMDPSEAVAQADGKLIVCGPFTEYQGLLCKQVLRFNTDGSLDNTFVIGTITDGATVFAVALQADGRILLGGNFTTFNGVPRNRLVRLLPDGTLDGTFADPTVTFTTVRDITVQSDGAILVVADNRFCRFLSTGAFDNTFAFGTSTSTGFTMTRVQADGKILYAGSFTKGIGRRTAAASDPTFNIGTGFNAAVYCIALQTDGKILIAGAFTSFNGSACNRIARLNTDGTLDNTFVAGSGLSVNGIGYGILPLADAIYICGAFSGYNGVTRPHFIRLQYDGTLDPFNAFLTNRSGKSLKVMAQRPDGRIFLAGDITDYAGVGRNDAMLIEANGDLVMDAFNTIGTGANQEMMKILVQADGQLLLAGTFSGYNGVSAMRLVRTDPEAGSIRRSVQGPVSMVTCVQRRYRPMVPSSWVVISPCAAVCLGRGSPALALRERWI